MLDAFEIALARGAAAFNSGDYLDAYEIWYEHWSEEDSADAGLLQGLLQAAVAFAKLAGGNATAAAKLIASARLKLMPYAPRARSVDVAGFLEELATWKDALAAGEGVPQPEAPRLNRVRPRARVVAGLFRRGTAVLAQCRPAGKIRAGLWELPGGKVEAGESDADALERECHEELVVAIEVGECVWTTSYDYDDLTVELAVYRATMAADAEPRARDASELRWVEARELTELPFCPADAPLVEQLSRGLH